jgi:Peptidase M30.
MKKLPILAAVFSLLLFACIQEEKEEPVIYKKFWACNISENVYYQIDAQMLAENDLCCVWAEKDSGVTEETAQKVADGYKKDIYYKMMETFGYKINMTDEKGNSVAIIDNVQFINWLVTGNLSGGKLTILLMDIKDNYQQGVNESFVAGYFWAGNLFKNRLLKDEVSNECDMIYIDTNPGIPGSKESNETLAHEMQHLMNYAGTVLRDKTTDLWIDEGLSVTAEWVYSNEHSAQRLYCYDTDISGLLGKGNNFFVWGNREEENQNAVLDDYSTVYLFFQWLRLQSGKDIYWRISSSKDYNYNAVINAFNDVVSGSKYNNWETMLQDWLAANYIKKNSGRYGYGNDTVLNNIKIHYAPGSSDDPATIILFPGEGVYSNVTGLTSIPAKAGNINYAGLNGSLPITSGSFSSGALLTYNTNTYNASKNNDGITTAESGTITGKAPPSPPSTSISSGGRSLGVSAGPFPISAGDMLRRKGKEGNFNSGGVNFKMPNAYRGIIVNE